MTRRDTSFVAEGALSGQRRVRAARRARQAKIPPPMPARVRAFAARTEKEARVQMRKRGRKRKTSAR